LPRAKPEPLPALLINNYEDTTMNALRDIELYQELDRIEKDINAARGIPSIPKKHADIASANADIERRRSIGYPGTLMDEINISFIDSLIKKMVVLLSILAVYSIASAI
jgi:hypothetical protein